MHLQRFLRKVTFLRGQTEMHVRPLPSGRGAAGAAAGAEAGPWATPQPVAPPLTVWVWDPRFPQEKTLRGASLEESVNSKHGGSMIFKF